MKVIIKAGFAVWALVGLLLVHVSPGAGIAWAAAGMPVVLIAGNWYRRPRRRRRT